jgi:hypothetical protein
LKQVLNFFPALEFRDVNKKEFNGSAFVRRSLLRVYCCGNIAVNCVSGSECDCTIKFTGTSVEKTPPVERFAINFPATE